MHEQKRVLFKNIPDEQGIFVAGATNGIPNSFERIKISLSARRADVDRFHFACKMAARVVFWHRYRACGIIQEAFDGEDSQTFKDAR